MKPKARQLRFGDVIGFVGYRGAEGFVVSTDEFDCVSVVLMPYAEVRGFQRGELRHLLAYRMNSRGEIVKRKERAQ